MKVSRLGVALAFAILAAARALPADTVTLPAASSLVGLAPFYSDVRAFNISYGSPLAVTAIYHCFIGTPCPSTPLVHGFTLGPRESLAFDDILVSLFDAPNTAGGIEFDIAGDASQLVVTSRLYSTSPTPTVGMFIPGLHDTDAQPSTVLTSIRNGGAGAGFRTNVGVYNRNNTSVSVTFTIFDAFGSLRGRPVSQLVAGHSGLQINGIFGAAGVGGLQTSNAVVTVSASGAVFSYAAVIDNATTDPIFVVGASDGPPVPPTITRTPSRGPSPTRTTTGGIVATATPTVTRTSTRSPSPTRTLSPTAGTPTRTFTASQTPTAFTPSITPTPTRTLSPTNTFTASPTFTISNTPTASRTPSFTPTFTATRTFTPSLTPSLTLTPTLTLSATASATASLTPTRTPTVTSSPTRTPTTNPNHVVFVGQGGGTTFVDSVSGTDTTTITVGTTVEWDWVTGLHSTTSGTCVGINCTPGGSPGGIWTSGQLTAPATFTQTFNTQGTFTYFCTVHTFMMQGTVVVNP